MVQFRENMPMHLSLKLKMFFILSFAFFAIIFFLPSSVSAAAVSCPVTDGGAGDGDSTVNGTIQISANTTWTATTGYAADGDYWDCTGVDILVTSNSTLTLEGDTSNGYHPYLKTDNLQIDSGSTISGDEEGCTSPSSSNGYGPNASNVCTVSTAGAGVGQTGGSSPGGAGGAGHGRDGGDGDTQDAGVSYNNISGTFVVPTNALFGSSGGSYRANIGGAGGGAVHLEVSGTFTHNGKVTANAGAGASAANGGGGGAGGSIYIDVGTWAGSTGTFESKGGAGGDGSNATGDGGGGAGGIITVQFTTDSFSPDGSEFDVSAGAGPDDAESGEPGQVYIKDKSATAWTLMNWHIEELDYSLSGSVTTVGPSITCDENVVTPSITATNLTFGGTFSCSESGLTDFDLSASTSFGFQGSASVTLGTIGADMDLTLPNNQTWSGISITLANEGQITVDDAVSITIDGNTTINSNVYWDGVTSVTIDSGSSINANGKGCSTTTSGAGSGPDGSNVCTNSTTGYGTGDNDVAQHKGTGGGGYGGAGGDGDGNNVNSGGTTYGDAAAPLFFGSSGGNARTNAYGGAGGGRIYINGTGTFTHDGALSADGEAGQAATATYDNAAGGGSGGTIYLITTTFAGATGTFSSDGGAGGNLTNAGGGGGGGGRVTISRSSDSSSYLSGLSAATVTVAGAAGGYGSSTAGSTGSFTINDTGGPEMTNASTADNDNDGQIDRIIVTLDEDVDGASVVGADFTVSSFTVSSASRTADSQITIIITESGSYDTSATPTVEIVGSIQNLSAQTTTSGTQVSVDGAAPIPYALSYTDFNNDGQVDRFDATFSEDIAYDECESGDFTFGGADAGSIAVSSCAFSTTTLQLTVTGAPSNDTNLSITMAYTAANGIAGSVDDAAGNAIADITATVAADAAKPLALSSSYTDSNSNGQVNRLDVLFTEDIARDECEAGDYTIGGADAGSIAVSSCTPNGTTMQFGLSNTPAGDTNLALQISYTSANGTANSLDDAAGNVVENFGPLTPTDAALPLIGGIAINDLNGDGLIDELIIDFSENIDTNDSAPPVLADFGTITLPDGSAVSSATISDPAGSNNVITLSNVVGQVTPNTGVGSTGIDGITNEWSDGVNLTSDPDEIEGVIDDAKPVIRTDGSNGPAYEDSNADGTVDRVKLVFSEASTITYSDGDWTVSSNGLTSLDVSGISSGNGTSTIYLTASAQSYLTGVGGLTEPNISFTPTTGSISDGTNSLVNIPVTDLTDSAAPALRTDGSNEPTYLDNDADGTIDRVRLTFTENATVTYNDGDWTATANDLTSFDVGAYLSGNGSTQIFLSGSAAANLTGVSGGTEPTLAFTATTGSIEDSGGASLSGFGAASLADGASPVSTAYVYKDADGNGTVDRMDVTFTESITVNECELADYSLTGSDSGGLSYSACGTNSADLQLTITGAPANDTNLALEFAYNAANGTANSLDDAGGVPVATISTQTATDGARPVLVTFAYSDEDLDSQVDRVTATFSENVTLDTYVDADWTATANDLTGFDVTGYNSGNGTTDIVLDATADAGQTGVSGGTEPTLGFTPTSSDVTDGSNNANVVPGTSLEDNAVMGVLTSAYKDINSDGAVDRLDVTFSEMPSVGECEAGDYSFGGADAGTLAVSACAVSGSDLRLTLNNGPSNDTNLSFTWNYDASAGTASSLEDGNATAAPDYNSVSPTDAAAPLRVSQQYVDADSNGVVDRFDITFTETIAYDECETGDYTIGGVDAGGLSIASCATSGDDLRLNVSGGSADDTFYTLTLAYTAANGTANSLDDAAGNAVGNLSGASLDDGAAPVATTFTYSDNNGDGQVDRVDLVFTETISLDECETEDWVIGGTDAGSIAVVDTSGCALGSNDLTLTLSDAPANDTLLDFTVSYADNETLGSLKDQGAQQVPTLSAITLSDASAPVLVSRTYLDVNNNGQIDRLDVTYTEPVTVSTCESGDHIFAGADAGSIAVSSCATSGNDVQYTLTGAVTNDTSLTLTYEYDKDASTANSLVDATGNAVADAAATSTLDGAAPVLRTDAGNDPKYLDADFDGQIDGVLLTFTENTTITYSDGDWTATANDLTGLDVSAIASGNGTSSITLTATASAGITGVDAGTQPTIAYVNTTGTIVDGSSNERSSISTTNFSDGAAPAAVSQNYTDVNGDGQVDRVDVTFSELVEQNECEAGDFSFGSTDAGSIAVSSCAISSNELRLTVSNAPAQDTNLDITWSYDASNGTANSVDDSAGNATGDQTGKTLADAAAPLLISSTPADSATSVASDADVVLTFTEPMDTGTLTYTYTNYSSGATVVWSSGNTVATLTPNGTYDSEAVVTFEITAVDDPSANSMANTISTHPFTFTTVAVDTASSGSLYVEKAGQYTSIYVYDSDDLTTPITQVLPGQSVRIIWVHNGNITTTELYYQTEEMNTSSTLIDLVMDGGTQSDWVIPTSVGTGQDLTVTAVNAQKVSYTASATVTVVDEEEEEEEEVIEEEEPTTSGQIRTDTSPGVYSTFEDGTRRVFLNSLTYFTWFDSFDAVETVETPVMSDYALTGVMLPKAGTVLVKIQSIPHVYYLEDNPDDPYQPILRWIPDEDTAIGLFGEDWALSVIDIEPTFFTKFATSDDPLSTSDVSWIDVDALRTREELAQ